jgi:hypothetical protein
VAQIGRCCVLCHLRCHSGCSRFGCHLRAARQPRGGASAHRDARRPRARDRDRFPGRSDAGSGAYLAHATRCRARRRRSRGAVGCLVGGLRPDRCPQRRLSGGGGPQLPAAGLGRAGRCCCGRAVHAAGIRSCCPAASGAGPAAARSHAARGGLLCPLAGTGHAVRRGPGHAVPLCSLPTRCQVALGEPGGCGCDSPVARQRNRVLVLRRACPLVQSDPGIARDDHDAVDLVLPDGFCRAARRRAECRAGAADIA